MLRIESQAKRLILLLGNMLICPAAGKYDFVTYSDSICYMQDEVEVGDVSLSEVYNAP